MGRLARGAARRRALPAADRGSGPGSVAAKLGELGVVDYIDKPWGHVKAGETFTVRSKLTSGFAGGQDVPMLFRGEKFTLPYTSLEPFVELVTGPSS